MTRVNLSIFSSKKCKLVLKYGFLLVLFISINIFLNEIFRYLLINDSKSYTRIMFHDLYTSDENIDVLFLGSSHCYRSINPEITDQFFGKNTFNAGTSTQSLDATYALLVEAEKTNEIEEVYLEMFYFIMGEDYSERDKLTHMYIVSDYMKPSLNRAIYILNGSPKEHWVNGFILSRRESLRTLEKGYLKKVWDFKNTQDYRNYAPVVNSDEYYYLKGFVYNDKGISNHADLIDRQFEPIKEPQLSEDDMKYLEKIINYCNKKHIKLNLFSSPMQDQRLEMVGNYDLYISQMQDFAKENGIEYIDFNLMKYEHFSYEDTLYMDSTHLNGPGANQFTKIFSQYFTKQIRDEDLFYDSFEERIKNKPSS